MSQNQNSNNNTDIFSNDPFPDLIINMGKHEEIEDTKPITIETTSTHQTKYIHHFTDSGNQQTQNAENSNRTTLTLTDPGTPQGLTTSKIKQTERAFKRSNRSGATAQPNHNNSPHNLQYVFTKLLDNSVAIDIMVGFFYFSGFLNLRHELKDKDIRILVGMEIDRTVRNAVEFALNPEKVLGKQNTAKAQQNFTTQIQQMFDSAYFEKPENKEAFQIFLEKIQNGTLEVRKTKSPAHAKLYILKPENPNEYSPGVIGWIKDSDVCKN